MTLAAKVAGALVFLFARRRRGGLQELAGSLNSVVRLGYCLGLADFLLGLAFCARSFIRTALPMQAPSFLWRGINDC
jgi:hypothetical protein